MATKNMWQSKNPAEIFYGGQGNSSLTPTYSVLCSGTTTTNPIQIVGSNGTAGEVLTSNGSAALPTWQSNGTTDGALVFLQTTSVTSASTLDITSIIDSTYLTYFISMFGYFNLPQVNTNQLNLLFSTNNGSSYLTTGYQSNVGYPVQSPFGFLQNDDSTTSCIIGPYKDMQAQSIVFGYYANIWLFGMASTTYYPLLKGRSVTDGSPATGGGFLLNGNCTGFNNTLGGVNAIRIGLASGTMDYLTVSIYGLVQ